MHLARTLLTGLCATMALVAGFFAALVAIAGIALFMILRLFGRPATRRLPRAGARPTRQPHDGAIEVIATEVPAGRSTETTVR